MVRPTALLVSMLLMACTGIDAIVVDAKEQPLPTADSGSDAQTAADVCDACLHGPNDPGPGCADEYAACDADAKCKAQQECYQERCSTKTASADVFRCGSQCFADLGVAIDDPASTLSYNIFLCSTGSCKSVCFPGE
jgi:hypothetical protein